MEQELINAEKRLVIYYQTVYTNGGKDFVSLAGLTKPEPCLTDLVVAAVHLNKKDATEGHLIHLNDWPPDDPRYDRLWEEVHALQRRGVNVLALLGGAAEGTYARLKEDFDTYYEELAAFLRHHRLDGLDIDIEEPNVSVDLISRLIRRLRADFGNAFLITMAPVAEDLIQLAFCNFDYRKLYQDCGEEIAWFNAQFYNGWGTLEDTAYYDTIAVVCGKPERRVVPLEKVVPIALTNKDNGASCYVDLNTLTETIAALRKKYPRFRGMAGWEYFNSVPDGPAAPQAWCQAIQQSLTS